MSLPLFALFLAAFAVGTNEFIVAGILPQISSDLGVDIPTAGYLISVYALGVAIGGPIVATLTGRLERKGTLLALMAVFIAGNMLCGVAPSYGWLMAGRVFISFSHGAFFGIAVVIAASLVPAHRHGTAIAIVVAGITVANILGVPAGTAIGENFGWRATFWAIAVLGVVATLCAAAWLPRSVASHEATPGLAQEVRSLARHDVSLSFAMIAFAATGFFALFSYVAPLLIEVSQLPPLALPWILSVFGVGALLGNLAGGWLADWKLMPSIIGIFVVLIAANVVLLFILSDLVTTTAVLFVWSFANFAFAAPLQSRIIKAAHEAPNLAAALISTAFNVGISAGAAIGAVALTGGFGYARLPWLGIAGTLPALVLALVSLFLDRRRAVAVEGAAA